MREIRAHEVEKLRSKLEGKSSSKVKLKPIISTVFDALIDEPMEKKKKQPFRMPKTAINSPRMSQRLLTFKET